jgi:hypothetical protein
LGQATYQIIAVMVLLFEGPRILEIEEGHIDEKDGINSIHYTLIFNTFVWMQLFNEINCRKLKGECKFNDTEREYGPLLSLTRVPLQQSMCLGEY